MRAASCKTARISCSCAMPFGAVRLALRAWARRRRGLADANQCSPVLSQGRKIGFVLPSGMGRLYLRPSCRTATPATQASPFEGAGASSVKAAATASPRPIPSARASNENERPLGEMTPAAESCMWNVGARMRFTPRTSAPVASRCCTARVDEWSAANADAQAQS